MRTRTLGAGGPQVSEFGLGTMAMSGIYGPADEAEATATKPLSSRSHRGREDG